VTPAGRIARIASTGSASGSWSARNAKPLAPERTIGQLPAQGADSVTPSSGRKVAVSVRREHGRLGEQLESRAGQGLMAELKIASRFHQLVVFL